MVKKKKKNPKLRDISTCYETKFVSKLKFIVD